MQRAKGEAPVVHDPMRRSDQSEKEPRDNLMRAQVTPHLVRGEMHAYRRFLPSRDGHDQVSRIGRQKGKDTIGESSKLR